MALTDADRQEIADLVSEALTQTLGRGSGTEAIQSLLKQPHLQMYPGPQRSRYTQVTLLDEQGSPRYQLRVRTGELRALMIAAASQEPGRWIPEGAQVEPIIGPKER